MNPVATIILSTKNRRELLEGALRSAVEQSAPVEVIVIDDGSSDGTAEMVRQGFPGVRLVSYPESRGYIVRRNEAVRLASTNYVFSIDDDAAFASRQTVEQTLKEFDDERCGAVAIPFINVLSSNKVVLQSGPGRCATSAFVGTAFAVRRDLFLQLGGFRECFFHQGEEEDYCIRLLDNGYFIRAGSADPIHHFESPIRDSWRLHVYGPRNLMMLCVLNIPWPYAPPHLVVSAIKCLVHGARIHRLRAKIVGVGKGVQDGLRYFGMRAPVSRRTYQMFRRLKAAQAIPLDTLYSS